jgi:hypothetical protein
MKSSTIAVVALFSLLAVNSLLAADADPTGTWKWTVMFNNQSRDMTLKLKLENGKLTGSMPGRDNTETAIEDGKFDAGKISFKVTRERNGQKFTSTYTGELKDDTIKGKIEGERGNGEKFSRDWEAKREK